MPLNPDRDKRPEEPSMEQAIDITARNIAEINEPIAEIAVMKADISLLDLLVSSLEINLNLLEQVFNHADIADQQLIQKLEQKKTQLFQEYELEMQTALIMGLNAHGSPSEQDILAQRLQNISAQLNEISRVYSMLQETCTNRASERETNLKHRAQCYTIKNEVIPRYKQRLEFFSANLSSQPNPQSSAPTSGF